MVKCVVSGCPNRLVGYNRGVFTRPPKRFFGFPADPDRVKVWLAALRETDDGDSAEQRLICQDHFLSEDISKNGVTGEAIPLTPPYVDGPLGPVDPWGAETSEEDEQWATGGCDDDDEDDDDDEGGLEAEETSVSLRQSKPSGQVTTPDAPLGLLTRRLLQLLLVAPDGSVDVRQAAAGLQTPPQRVCDVADILDGISLMRKESADRIKWIGWCPISSFLWRKRHQFQRELDYLKLVENTLDSLIKGCAQQLFDLTDDVDNAASAYVTLDDLRGLGGCRDQTLLIVKAPQETKLEIPEPTEDGIQVHLKAGLGPIVVMTCDMGSGDAVTSDPAEESRIRTTGVFGSTERSAEDAATIRPPGGAIV